MLSVIKQYVSIIQNHFRNGRQSKIVNYTAKQKSAQVDKGEKSCSSMRITCTASLKKFKKYEGVQKVRGKVLPNL